MAASIETISAGALQNITGTPTEDQWNANPALFRSKINELIGYLNRMHVDILTGFSGTVAVGTPCYVDTNQALQALTSGVAVELHNFIFGFGTGVAGQLQIGGWQSATNIAPAANKLLHVGADGSLAAQPPRTAGAWQIPIAISETTGKIYVIAEQFWGKVAQVGSY